MFSFYCLLRSSLLNHTPSPLQTHTHTHTHFPQWLEPHSRSFGQHEQRQWACKSALEWLLVHDHCIHTAHRPVLHKGTNKQLIQHIDKDLAVFHEGDKSLVVAIVVAVREEIRVFRLFSIAMKTCSTRISVSRLLLLKIKAHHWTLALWAQFTSLPTMYYEVQTSQMYVCTHETRWTPFRFVI